ncbi:MAG TPA: 4Fe-4S dicluster domain-containing protein [Bacteroidales bacterium]|nr:4Fe-4S dicluster domain-containing protein [Bacteroidales bacterium]
MMQGFIFDSGKCVRCNACSAACFLENGWAKTRQAYTWNEEARPGLPVFNLSLACNHCENPTCLQACPAKCYTHDGSTGAILLNQENCLGCKYCAWNCPYKAPRFNRQKRIMEKCNLCYSAVAEGDMPSCVNACPTGALAFGGLPSENNVPEWFHVKKLNPRISFADGPDRKIRTVPENKFEPVPGKKASMRWKDSDTSLAVFTFLVTILVSVVSATLLKGKFPGKFIVISLSMAAALVSLIHLGKPLRAWKSVLNIRSSPLSREILIFIVFSVLSFSAVYFQNYMLLIFAVASGLITLIIIDSVYNHVCSSSWFHSGQTFLTSLLLISYLTASLTPFTFVVMIKMAMSVRLLIKKKEMFPALRYLRIIILFTVWAGLISGFNQADSSIFVILLMGEVADRLLFYSDFQPENIRIQIDRHLTKYINEEKRG